MGIFNQFANVIEWEEMRDDTIFWKWKNKEIKKGSRLIIRPGQDAIFFKDGVIEGIFRDSGSYDVDSQIIPFLSTLKGFKFGFNSGMRAEVLFVNVKEFLINWGTKSPINIPAQGLPGGMPLRLRGTFTTKIVDYVKLIDNIAGLKNQFTVEDIKERIVGMLDQLLMKWIVREGKDMFHLMSYADEIGGGIKTDLDMELFNIGATVTSFKISAVTYPEEIQKRIESVAAANMVGDVSKYQQVAMADSIAQGKGSGAAMDILGMTMAQNLLNQQSQQTQAKSPDTSAATDSSATKFCSECGAKIARSAKFCPECGTKF